MQDSTIKSHIIIQLYKKVLCGNKCLLLALYVTIICVRNITDTQL